MATGPIEPLVPFMLHLCNGRLERASSYETTFQRKIIYAKAKTVINPDIKPPRVHSS